MQHLSDEQLLQELQHRFGTIKKTLEEHKKLLHELEDVNKKLVESERVKTQFLSNIRNEINNPLASILGLSKKIGEDPADLQTIGRLGKLIHHEAFNLNFQINNVLVAADIESGELAPKFGTVDMPGLLERIKAEFYHMVDKKKIVLKISNSIDAGHVLSDSFMLHVVLSNMVENAIKFSYDGGQVDIRVECDDKQLIMRVGDSGIGIDEREQPMIYNRFKQLHEGQTKPYSGHGLGLSVVKDIVEMLKGTISLVSGANQGSVFTIVIPMPGEDAIIDSALDENNAVFNGDAELF